MNVKEVLVTPEMAANILSMNTSNRPVCRINVNRFAVAMRRGEWKNNGEPIQISKTGRLLNGQHRLMAIIVAQVSIAMIIIEGLDDSVFDTIDSGKSRTGADVLSIENVKNATRVAACLSIVSDYYNGDYGIMCNHSLRGTEILSSLEKFPDLPKIISSAPITKLCPPRITDSCLYIFSKKDNEMAFDFIGSIASGLNLSSGSPALLFRERMLNDAKAKSKISPRYKMALLIKAWNHFVSGNKIKQLKVSETGNNTEDFPIAIGLENNK